MAEAMTMPPIRSRPWQKAIIDEQEPAPAGIVCPRCDFCQPAYYFTSAGPCLDCFHADNVPHAPPDRPDADGDDAPGPQPKIRRLAADEQAALTQEQLELYRELRRGNGLTDIARRQRVTPQAIEGRVKRLLDRAERAAAEAAAARPLKNLQSQV